MRINFFSIIIAMLCLTSFGKVLYLFDRIMINAANIETKATTLFVVDSAVASEKKAEFGNKDEKPAESAKEETISEAKHGKKDTHDQKSKSKTEPPVSSKENPKDGKVKNLLDLDVDLNKEQINLLKELSKRREVLDNYQQQLTTKESILKSTEAKLEQKMQEMQAMQERISALLKQMDDKSNLRIKSLAKIYENMKPQEAAKIFDELEMPILLEIIRNMKEQKVAPIIAQMNPVKAKDVSLDFAKTNEFSNSTQP